MTIGQIKLVAFVFAVLNVWLILHTPWLANAVLMFLAGGTVPGTHIILSPDAAYSAAGALFVIIFLLLFRSGIVRLLRAPFARKHPKHLLEPLETISKPVAEPAKEQGRDRGATIRQMFFMRLVIWRLRLAIKVALLGQHVARLARAAVPYIVGAAQFVWHIIILLALLLQAGWELSEPPLRRFDAWLGAQLHRNKISNEVLKMMREFMDDAVLIARKIHESAKVLVQTVHKFWQTSASNK